MLPYRLEYEKAGDAAGGPAGRSGGIGPFLIDLGQPTLRLIFSADSINAAERLPVVLGLRILSSDPGGLLAVHIERHAWASAPTIEAVTRRRLVEHLDTATAEAMELVDAALRAAQEL